MLIPYNWIAMGGDQNNLHPNYKMSSGHTTPSFKVTMLLARPKLENQLLNKNISCEKSIAILQLVLSSRSAVALPMVDICAIDLEDREKGKG